MKLDGKLDEIIEMIVEGKTFREIGAFYNVSINTVHYFLTLEENAAKATAALEVSAATYADKAEQVLWECEGTKEEIMRARELAQHYRWKASKRSPKKYGDKVDVTSAGEKIQSIQVEVVRSHNATEDTDK